MTGVSLKACRLSVFPAEASSEPRRFADGPGGLTQALLCASSAYGMWRSLSEPRYLDAMRHKELPVKMPRKLFRLRGIGAPALAGLESLNEGLGRKAGIVQA